MLRHGMRGMARAARNNVFSGGANQLPRHLSRSLLPVQTRAVGSLVIGSSQPGITIAAPEGDLEVVSPLLMDLWGLTGQCTLVTSCLIDRITC
eukprot:TRINITY_DN670_c0_g1_i2.p3 TRINITY_DN670_c0_g1~~TRINITY_DN670_c0_g1_i2.p3  ORF type:complete len:100 (+),score=9.61 TRINITY_DN670_c0_g1_i2:23-301(+)